ncbi:MULTISPECIES: hypothetical protein [unclassified Acinetobacter]|uniref:hypothetical protein n=1 Tax=unclassified Acinetobacter TaxID=196816 RepID=UPI0015D2C9C6|nr:MULTISPECIES: hypothetical protein [unclassified Acinetobacter]
MMSYVDYAVALDEISKMTKQQCNEFTLLHYVKNGLLDLYVKLNTGFDLCECSIAEDLAYLIKKQYVGYVRLDISDITNIDLFNCISSSSSLSITQFKHESKNLGCVLLKENYHFQKAHFISNYSHPEDKNVIIKRINLSEGVEELYKDDASPVELSTVVAVLGLVENIVFSFNDIKFSLAQIKKLQNKPIIQLNPKVTNIDIRNKRMDLGRRLGIQFIKNVLPFKMANNQEDLVNLVNCTLRCFNQERDFQTIIDWCKEENLPLPSSKE